MLCEGLSNQEAAKFSALISTELETESELKAKSLKHNLCIYMNELNTRAQTQCV